MAAATVKSGSFYDTQVAMGGIGAVSLLLLLLAYRHMRSRLRALGFIREALLAYRLTQTLSKSQILERYLNEIYYGNQAYGIEAASRAYFGKHARDLTLAEASMLAGLRPRPICIIGRLGSSTMTCRSAPAKHAAVSPHPPATSSRRWPNSLGCRAALVSLPSWPALGPPSRLARLCGSALPRRSRRCRAASSPPARPG